ERSGDRHRLGLRGAGGGGAAARARPPRGAAGGHGPARRARGRLPPRRLHLRRGAHRHHRPVSPARAVRAGGARLARLLRAGPRGPVLPRGVPGRHPLRLRGRRGAAPGADPGPLPARRGRLPAAGRARGKDLRRGLHPALRRALRPHVGDDARAPRHAAAGEPPLRVRAGGEVHPGRAAAAGVLLRAPAGGRQPVPHHLHLPPHPLAGAEVGRLVREGGHHLHRAWAGEAAGRDGGGDALRDAGRADRDARRPRGGGARRRAPHRRVHGGGQRRSHAGVRHAAGPGGAQLAHARRPAHAAVLHGALRGLLRHAQAVPAASPPHHPHGPALPGAAGRHLRPQGAGGRLLPLPARPHAHRSRAGAAGVRDLLRALPRPQPAGGDRLGRGGTGVLRPHPGAARAHPSARAAREPGDLVPRHAHLLPRHAPLHARGGVRHRAAAHAVGVLPLPQPVAARGRALLRGRGHAPRRGGPGRPFHRQSAGAGDAGARRV
ncbi:MAG: Phytoene desaturase (neurosporene-forming), partial [uncultured Gemmatimonadetes bacterium]